MENEDFLKELAEDAENIPSDEKLEKLKQLIKKMVGLQQQVDQFDALMKQSKEILHQISDFDIPNAMDEAGVSSFTTDNGIAVLVKSIYTGKITDENKSECFRWLEHSGNSGIIKHQVEVKLGREEHELATKIKAYFDGIGVDYTDKESVHWATLNAFIKEQITSGKDFPMETFNVYVGRTTKLSRN